MVLLWSPWLGLVVVVGCVVLSWELWTGAKIKL